VSEEKQKWPVAGMIGLAFPVIITKQTGFNPSINEDDLQSMLDEVDEVMKKHGFEIDKISNNYYYNNIEEKAKAVDSLKAVILD
jgi:hypothetical protein